VQIGAADARGTDPDAHLTGAGADRGDVIADLESLVADRAQHRGLHAIISVVKIRSNIQQNWNLLQFPPWVGWTAR
jgi:hypothetical protein